VPNGYQSDTSIDPSNPQFPTLTCSVNLGSAMEGSVRWASVRYDAGLYERGCVNECSDPDMGGVTQCPTYQMDANDGFDCDENASENFGEIRCGCLENYGGESCQLGCPDTMVSIQAASFNVFTRAGYWMCGGLAASVPNTLTSGSMTLRGFIPETGFVGTPMVGPAGPNGVMVIQNSYSIRGWR
jgi:hypothetical protein